MAYATSYNTIDRVIRTAMFQAGLLEIGVDPSSEDLALYMNVMNDLINARQTVAVKFCLNFDQSVTPIQGTYAYPMGPGLTVNINRPTRVIDGYFLDATGNQRPIFSISEQEWNVLPNKTLQGPPNSYYTTKTPAGLTWNIWMTPDASTATGILHAIVQIPVQNFAGLMDSPNATFPVEWYNALVWGLADEICTGQPQAIIQRCKEKSAYYWNILEEWDVEDTAIQFTMDNRSDGTASRFR